MLKAQNFNKKIGKSQLFDKHHYYISGNLFKKNQPKSIKYMFDLYNELFIIFI